MAINDQNRSRKTYSFFKLPAVPSTTVLSAGLGILLSNAGGAIVISIDPSVVQTGGSSVTGSVSLSSSLASVNTVVSLTNEGNVDWFAPGNNSVQSFRGSTFGHSKILGGWLQLGFDWVTQGGTLSATTSSYILSASATDDIGNGLAFFTTADEQISTPSSTLTGFGYRLSIPADKTTRTLRIYGALSSSKATFTARASDGSFSDVTASIDATSPGTLLPVWTLQYNTANTGQRVYVQLLTTVNHGGTPFVKFTAATLSSSV